MNEEQLIKNLHEQLLRTLKQAESYLEERGWTLEGKASNERPQMKDSLRFVYEQTKDGWKRIYEAQSFQNALFVAKSMMELAPNKKFCVNS